MNCPDDLELIDFKCYEKCPTNYKSQYKKCISTIACSAQNYNLMNDSTNPDICKKGAPTQPPCAAGTTQWFINQCYIDCPVEFFEGGNICEKKYFIRESVSNAYCSFGYTLINQSCVLSFYSLFWIFLFICIIILLVYRFKSYFQFVPMFKY